MSTEFPFLTDDGARHKAMDRALVEISELADQFARAASRRILKRTDW